MSPEDRATMEQAAAQIKDAELQRFAKMWLKESAEVEALLDYLEDK